MAEYEMEPGQTPCDSCPSPSTYAWEQGGTVRPWHLCDRCNEIQRLSDMLIGRLDTVEGAVWLGRIRVLAAEAPPLNVATSP